MSVLKKKTPQSGVEYADEHFYLPEGSSQISGRWTTQPLQVVPLNMMCNDAIRSVYMEKSARVGYTKMLVAAASYLSEHKSRNGVIYQPTDDDAKDFVLDEIDATWANMPIIQAAFPGWNANDETNTVKKKIALRFTLDIKGANSSKNFRRITKQFVIGDEINAWPLESGNEGDPIKLAIKRLDGAAFPKDIFGTTPTVTGVSHIERLMKGADAIFSMHVPCPHCKHEQTLGWGGKGSNHGMKWNKFKPVEELTPSDVYYQCKNPECEEKHPQGKGRFYYKDLAVIEPGARWIDEKKGFWTVDGENFYSSAGTRIETPKRCGVRINALYSLTLTDGWVGLVREWLDAKGDPLKLKAFINLVLGQHWEDETGEKLDWEVLHAKREAYRAQVPMKGVYLTCFVDTQDDRFELVTVAWGRGEEMYIVDEKVIYGDPHQPLIWNELRDYLLNSRFKHESGAELRIRRFGQDAGGHFWDDVQKFVNSFTEPHFAVACKGDHQYGQPVVRYDPNKNKHGNNQCWLGTDSAKDIIYGRYGVVVEPDDAGKMPTDIDPVPGMIHFPIAPFTTQEFFEQSVAEVKKLIIDKKGRKTYRYELKTAHERNEKLDCLVGNLAMVRLGINYFNLNLNSLWESMRASMGKPAKARPAKVKKRKKKVTGGIT